MKERPILFSGRMVCVLLKGRKTQTRRIVTPQPVWTCTRFELAPFKGYGRAGEWVQMSPDERIQLGLGRCRYGNVNDRLWVKETFSQPGGSLHFRADDDDHSEVFHWKPSIFMPRSLSRITLEIVGVSVERLNSISESDARAEGGPSILGYVEEGEDGIQHGWLTYREWYAWLWDAINGPGAWAKNPWVWKIEFKKI